MIRGIHGNKYATATVAAGVVLLTAATTVAAPPVRYESSPRTQASRTGAASRADTTRPRSAAGRPYATLRLAQNPQAPAPALGDPENDPFDDQRAADPNGSSDSRSSESVRPNASSTSSPSLDAPAPANPQPRRASPLPAGVAPNWNDAADLTPGANGEYEIPLAGALGANAMSLESRDGRVSVLARNAPLRDVLEALAQKEGLNLVCADDVQANVSITLSNVPLDDALTAIVSVGGCTWAGRRGIIYVTNASTETKLAPEVQDRQVRVFHLNYITAASLDEAVKGMLSSTGTSYVITAAIDDNRKSHEALVVEDMPAFVDRVSEYVYQVDVPPQQVEIEVHVLQIDLKDDMKHGVNFSELVDIVGGTVQAETLGFAAATATQGAMLRLNGSEVTSLIELLKTSTDAKTLASPRVMVINGQESKIQVGQQLGFSTFQQTQTSTLQNVQFLDVGVVLTVTPRISNDHRVLLRVKPEVSSGAVNPQTGLPEKGTSEVETNVLLEDGQAVVLGGLIQERDLNTQNKVPWLGDLKYIGHLFQKRQLVKQRNEVIFVLVPRVFPGGPCLDPRNATDVMRATTPLLHGPLLRVQRPWDPSLADPSDNPRPVWPLRDPFASEYAPAPHDIPSYPAGAAPFPPGGSYPSHGHEFGPHVPSNAYPAVPRGTGPMQYDQPSTGSMQDAIEHVSPVDSAAAGAADEARRFGSSGVRTSMRPTPAASSPPPSPVIRPPASVNAPRRLPPLRP